MAKSWTVSPEFLDRLIRKMKYDWVQAPQRNPRELGDYPKVLSYHLLDAITPFLETNLRRSSPSDLISFREKLGEVFADALKLTRQRSLQAEELAFRWISANSLFDPKFMKVEGTDSSPHGSKVQVCLSPALVRTKTRSISEGPEETVVYEALVSLQPQAGHSGNCEIVSVGRGTGSGLALDSISISARFEQGRGEGERTVQLSECWTPYL